MKLLGVLAQCSIVLLYEVPSNLLLGKIAVAVAVATRRFGGTGGCWILLSRAPVLILLGESTIGGCHLV